MSTLFRDFEHKENVDEAAAGNTVVVLEGVTDVEVLEIFFSDDLGEFEFQAAGSCTAVEPHMQKLLDDDIEAYGLKDRDSLLGSRTDLFMECDSDFATRHQQGRIRVLLRWEIENYLIANMALLSKKLHEHSRRPEIEVPAAGTRPSGKPKKVTGPSRRMSVAQTQKRVAQAFQTAIPYTASHLLAHSMGIRQFQGFAGKKHCGTEDPAREEMRSLAVEYFELISSTSVPSGLSAQILATEKELEKLGAGFTQGTEDWLNHLGRVIDGKCVLKRLFPNKDQTAIVRGLASDLAGIGETPDELKLHLEAFKRGGQMPAAPSP